MIADPPSDVGALQESAAWAFPGTAIALVGAPGIVRGVTALEAIDESELPAALIATTVKVYAVPLASPEKVQERFAVLVQSAGAATAGDDVTEYPVIVAPPLDAGALQESETCELPGVAVTDVGDPGMVRGVIESDALDGADSPWALMATTVKV